jgi:3-oxoadipate CoA-transferase alpha subunit
MATAATTVIAQVTQILPTGALDPESVITPGIYIDRIVTPDLTRQEPRR